ncbi:MAG TPA: sulfate reduction electron transfer complex DsrMKJOP subunit DsrM [Thermodesulfobacteriota bacterium]|nr:sulfate reduction electron transfer complex DsrMKJOP subunit DsrM [Thermodesulfobacteriota bacterium]
MNIIYSLLAVILLMLLPVVGVAGLGSNSLFGIVVPYTALAIFVAGFIYRVLKWGSSPVPFSIPTVCGQQKSLPWIHASHIDSPHTTKGIIARLALEVLFFRSLFWNERVELRRAYQLLYKRNLYLWLGGLVFHWCLFVILFRHLRFFTEPVPSLVLLAQTLDGILQPLFPVIYITDVFILFALIYLLLRRISNLQMRYISLPSDYFALFLVLGVVFSGILMRLIYRVDLVKVKGLMVQIFGFQPVLPEGIGTIFYVHLFLVSILIGYFPFSKLMHLAGVFLSPTRNLKNNSRMERYINPWNCPVKVHSYEEYEDEFRQNMKEAGIPVEKE